MITAARCCAQGFDAGVNVEAASRAVVPADSKLTDHCRFMRTLLER
jgi:hypothetical protein